MCDNPDEIALKITEIEVSDKEANLNKISEQMLNRKNSFWKALERLFIATNKFTVSRKILLNDAKEFYALFLFYNIKIENPSIQPAIASLRLVHYIAAAFEQIVKNIDKEVILIVKNGRKIMPIVIVENDCQKYIPPVFIGISVEMTN